MITGTKPASETSEAVTMIQNKNVKDEIKRNHLQSPETEQVSARVKPTDFTVKFARLKKSLRKRSSTIF